MHSYILFHFSFINYYVTDAAVSSKHKVLDESLRNI